MYQAPRGTADILPEEQAYWRYIEQKAAEISQLYGYRRIDTPVFEDTGLFIRGVGEETDIVQKEMYTFEDRGGNKLTLRPEGTAPVCRAYLEHGMQNLPQPVKLFYITSLYRYERPQAGRYREFHQFGCEAIGEVDPALDAEVIDMAWQFFLSLGIEPASSENQQHRLQELPSGLSGQTQRILRSMPAGTLPGLPEPAGKKSFAPAGLQKSRPASRSPPQLPRAMNIFARNAPLILSS